MPLPMPLPLLLILPLRYCDKIVYVGTVFFNQEVLRRAAAAVARVVFNQDEDTLTLKANKANTAPDLILNRWPSPR